MGSRKCKLFTECKSAAVYKIPHSGLSFCAYHFMQNVENRVKKLIEKKHLFHPDNSDYPEHHDKILVAVSGGKDSQVLLRVLKNLYPESLEIHGLYIELGIHHNNYSKESGDVAQQYCAELGIPYHQISILEDYGIDIDKIDWMKQEFENRKLDMGKDHFRGACSYCGMFKRYAINKFAYENGFTRVATGHNLTDESTALVNNFFNMELTYMVRGGPFNDSQVEGLVPRIKPLFFISEPEIMMYAYYGNVPHLGTECIYSPLAPNQEIKQIMQEIEDDRKGNMIGMMRRFHKVLQPILQNGIGMDKKINRICKKCGGSTLSTTCYFCRNVDSLIKRYNQVKLE